MTASAPRPLNILMLAPQFRPVVGGYERAAERLAAALVARGHRVTVLTERRQRAWPAREHLDGMLVRRIWCLHRPGVHTVSALASFATFLLAHGRRFDVWHVHQYGGLASLAIALGRVLRRPVVLKLTNSREHGLAATVAASRLPRVLGALQRRAHAVVALTRETAEEARAFGIPGQRVHVLGNGVDTRRFAPADAARRRAAREALDLSCDGMVLCASRLVPEKNPDAVLRIWARIRPALDGRWLLVMLGEGPLRESLERAVAEGAIPDVMLPGRREDVERYMAAADVFVSASSVEGLSNTLLEAMASGLPVVSTRVSGATEILEETGAGMVTEVGDEQALGEAIVALAGDEAMRGRLGRAARSVVEGTYSIEAVAERHDHLYQALQAAPAGRA